MRATALTGAATPVGPLRPAGTARPGHGSPAAEGSVREREEPQGADAPWSTVVWNDPVNLMTYVVYVFRAHFGYGPARAERLMRQVHEEGRAIVSRGSRERVEADVAAMHGYGLRATIEQGEGI